MVEQIIDLEARYNQFQDEAVLNVINDFSDNLTGRFLLAIPTGGGKTFTAIKAINRLFQKGILDPASDRVVWTAHRQELLDQANETRDKFQQNSTEEFYLSSMDIMMIHGVRDHIKENSNVRIVVIDEAHRSAGTVMYNPLFDYPNIGIFGLTATPSRHDGQPLRFDKESYSIGFPDLVEKQIILNPVILEIKGGRFENVVKQGASYGGMDQLETNERDGNIISHIQEQHENYKKIIIFVGSISHSESLCRRMNSSPLKGLYESIDYIHGRGWSGGGGRKEFIERLKSHDRSIIINYDILTEGYDDPTVNTVIMARPSQSKLVYMQAVGRAIRVNPEDPNKTAFIVEVADDLPNIRYRINNRWLFSEISDTLEPAVRDDFFGSADEFRASLKKIYLEYNVEEEYQLYPEWKKSYRYSLILFRSLSKITDSNERIYRHFPILIDNENRMAVSSWFNFLSERIEKNRNGNINAEAAMQMSGFQNVDLLKDQTKRQLVYEAMNSASEVACSEFCPESAVEPWVTFFALRYRENKIDQEIQNFIADMVNREQIENQIKNKSYEGQSRIVKFPLPLSSYFGQIVTSIEFEKLDQIIMNLKDLKNAEGDQDHRNSLRELMDKSILPLDLVYRESLPTIVREDYLYYLTLK